MDGVILSNARPFATDRPYLIAIFPHGTNGHELSHSGCPLLGVERVGNLYRSLVILLPRRDRGINRRIVQMPGAGPADGPIKPNHDSKRLGNSDVPSRHVGEGAPKGRMRGWISRLNYPPRPNSIGRTLTRPLRAWILLKKVEASCDRYLIAGGTNVEAEWEQGPAV
jgi:hypothetical protein